MALTSYLQRYRVNHTLKSTKAITNMLALDHNNSKQKRSNLIENYKFIKCFLDTL